MFPVDTDARFEIETIGVAILALPGVELPIGAAVATIRAVRSSDRYKAAWGPDAVIDVVASSNGAHADILSRIAA